MITPQEEPNKRLSHLVLERLNLTWIVTKSCWPNEEESDLLSSGY